MTYQGLQYEWVYQQRNFNSHTNSRSRPDRLKSIAERFEVDPDTVLENVIFARAYTSEHQMELINMCAAKFAEERNTYRLLVSDENVLWVTI